MPAFNLQTDDPLVGTTFYLEIQGVVMSNLSGVDGLAVEVETTDVMQRTADGKFVQHTAMAKPKYTGALTLKRYAPLDMTNDALWKWFNDIRDKGMPAGNRASQRKSGSVVVYDTSLAEISRWNFTECWPSKIESDGLDVTKNDPVTETITMQYETLNRIK
jgi:phage tail-like protein